jgi:hypothetical protein
MSDHRKPVEIWLKRLPQSEGKKVDENCNLKVELFPSHYWAQNWEPASKLFFPKLPLQSKARQEYWLKRFRVRVNGVWAGSQAKYVTFTKEMIRERYFK